jgi:signal transduction histidine kinase
MSPPSSANAIANSRRPGHSALRARAGALPQARGSHPRASAGKTVHPTNVTRAAVLEERARIARELHDSVAQTLYAIALCASRARSLLQQNAGTEVQRSIDDVLHLANAGQDELRGLLTTFRSDRHTSGGLTAPLANLAADTRRHGNLDIRLSLSDEPDVPAETKEALVMIVREALHNVVKHSAARRVDIVLEHDGGQLMLLIADDGHGFDPTRLRPGHFGLQSMRDRATAVGGTLALISAVGRGTQLRLCTPMHMNRDG